MSVQLHRVESDAARRAGVAANSDVPGGDASSIKVVAGDLARVVHEAIAALQAGNVSIYNRGGALVRPIVVDTPDAGPIQRSVGSMVLERVTADWLRLRLAQKAIFTRYRAREGDWRPIDPPTEIARTIASTPDEGGWPHLRALVRHPVLWLDGSYTPSGYRAGLLIDAPGEWSAPSTHRADATDALSFIREHLRFMPWASAADEAVGIAAVLTSVMRPVLDAAPMFACDAPAAGTGKSLFADVNAILATGASGAVMDYGRDADEAAKRLDAMQLAGDSIIIIDNVEAPLEGAAFCSTLTQPTRRIRVLGGHDVVNVPCTAMLMATGNNLVIRGDLVRRTLVCRLDARSERPELRDIPQDLIAETHANRAKLVAAAQTIVGAYISAGRPDMKLAALGSYRHWSANIRSSLVWLGLADPVATMDRIRTDDPKREAIAAILAAWLRAFGDKAVTARGAVARAEHDDKLHDALAMVALRRGALSARSLSYWLRQNRDARQGAMVLTGERDPASNTTAWSVHRSGSTTAGDAGDTGDTQTDHARSGMTNHYQRAATSPTSPVSPAPGLSDACPLCDGEGCHVCDGTGVDREAGDEH